MQNAKSQFQDRARIAISAVTDPSSATNIVLPATETPSMLYRPTGLMVKNGTKKITAAVKVERKKLVRQKLREVRVRLVL